MSFEFRVAIFELRVTDNGQEIDRIEEHMTNSRDYRNGFLQCENGLGTVLKYKYQ
jgi:hypothetical protein